VDQENTVLVDYLCVPIVLLAMLVQIYMTITKFCVSQDITLYLKHMNVQLAQLERNVHLTLLLVQLVQMVTIAWEHRLHVVHVLLVINVMTRQLNLLFVQKGNIAVD
jgi:hypothetical protein